MRNFHITWILMVLSFILLIGLDTFMGIPLWWYFILTGLSFLIMAVASFSMSWNFYLKSFTSKKNIKERKIAITFDDGPNSEFTSKVLDLLKKHDAKATFFCIGQNIAAHPELLKSISQEGHAIGNHSWTHQMMIDFNSVEKWLTEIKQTDNAIKSILGTKTTLFRPPFGVTTPKLAKALKVTEHLVIGWNIRSYDTVGNNPKRIVKNLIKRVKPGAIILLHDKQPNVLYVLEHLLQFLKNENYKCVTINEFLNEE